MRFWSLLILFLAPFFAVALTLSEAEEAEYTKKDFMGLCTDQNKNQLFFGRGVCGSLKKAIEAKDCGKGGGQGDPLNKIVDDIWKMAKGQYTGPQTDSRGNP